MDMRLMSIIERKLLKKIHSPRVVNGESRQINHNFKTTETENEISWVQGNDGELNLTAECARKFGKFN